MLVYHGSIEEVIKPDILHSGRNLDFGSGFYVTTVIKQAERWAKRKADILGRRKPIVSVYEMVESYELYSVLDFNNNLESWIDFVCNCRAGGKEYMDYDIIRGKVANDKVFRVVDLYMNGVWDKERAISEIKVYENYDQIAFISQDAIDDLLHFNRSYQVLEG